MLCALCDLTNLLCGGSVPSDVVPHLCGASLLPCKKRGGGLRLIAVGEVLRRLTSKCISSAVQNEASRILSPLQLGVGVPGGCEAIVHAVSSLQEDPSIDQTDKLCLLLDFSNAFNSISRENMFEEIRDRIPSMAAWLECCYGSQPLLHLGDRTIRSCSGVQQGDPLGPLGFALTLHPFIEKIREVVPDLKINAWYLDDGTLCGSASNLRAALAIIEDEGPARGLHLNREKSLLYIPKDCPFHHNPLPQDIPISRTGFVLLGSPIGPPSFCEMMAMKRVQKIQDLLSKLPDLQDSHMESGILRSCLAFPKISFTLRCCPPNYIQEAVVAFDNLIEDAVSDLVGGHLPAWSWLKATLPVSLGGLGLRRASLYAPAAYTSSFVQSKPLVAKILGKMPSLPEHFSSVLSHLAGAAARPDWATLENIDVPLRQRSLSRAIDLACFEKLCCDAPDSRSKALALCSSTRHAGDWLNAIPSKALGLHLHDLEFRSCLQYWLGLSLVEEHSKCPVCQSPADPFGDHQIGCGGNGDRVLRHDSLRNVLFSASQSAALAPRKEVPSLIPGSKSRPADLYLPYWKHGKPAALDVSVISPMQHLTVSKASAIQGHALSVGEDRKIAAHASSCHSVGVSFIPLIVETFGGWSNLAVETIKSIGRLQGQRLGISPAQTTTHLFQRLAICLWKGNATMWMRRLPVRSPKIDGVV